VASKTLHVITFTFLRFFRFFIVYVFSNNGAKQLKLKFCAHSSRLREIYFFFHGGTFNQKRGWRGGSYSWLLRATKQTTCLLC